MRTIAIILSLLAFGLSKSTLSAEKQELFQKLLTEFIQTYSLSIGTSRDFYHRLPKTFKD